MRYFRPSDECSPDRGLCCVMITLVLVAENIRAKMRELFRRSDELRYSGRQNGNGVVTEQTRREMMELIESLF